MDHTFFANICRYRPCVLQCLKLLRFKWSQPSGFLTALFKCGDRVRAKIGNPDQEGKKVSR